MMGFGHKDFPNKKIPGRTNFGGGSIGMTFNVESDKLILYIDKVKMGEIKVQNVERLGIGISKFSMEVFLTVNGELVKTEKVKNLAKLYPVINIANEVKVEVFFEK